MYPEYALDGIFSVKSNVYSFGVLVLEIVSGTKMRGFYLPDLSHNLLAHAWRLYKDDKFWELIDEAIVESCNPSEAFRAIQIGLMCVQPYPEDRPSMSLVILMLSSEIEMPQPEQPNFFTRRTQLGPDFGMPPQFSASDASTLLSPRSPDGYSLFACSLDGTVAIFHFKVSELGHRLTDSELNELKRNRYGDVKGQQANLA